jgi:hAT family C-terminal dimerisation region
MQRSAVRNMEKIAKAGRNGHNPIGAKSVVRRRRFWTEKAYKKFPILAAAANKLLSMHVTTAAAERNWSAWGRLFTSARNQLGLEKAEKMIKIKANYADSDSDDDNEGNDEIVALDHMA